MHIPAQKSHLHKIAKYKKNEKILTSIILILLVLLAAQYYYFKNAAPWDFFSSNQVEEVSYDPVFRQDIKAHVIADIDDENGDTLYYVLRFYSASGEKISDPIAVDVSSVRIDENGVMSIQVIDDIHTSDGAVYASTYIYESIIDPADKSPKIVEVGEPCILTDEAIVITCESYLMEVNLDPAFSATQSDDVVVSNGSGITAVALLADATEAQKMMRRPAARPRPLPNQTPKVQPANKPTAKPHSPTKPKKTNKPSQKKKSEPKLKKKTQPEHQGQPDGDFEFGFPPNDPFDINANEPKLPNYEPEGNLNDMNGANSGGPDIQTNAPGGN